MMPSVTTLRVSLNLPPKKGTFIITPIEGEALKTNFEFKCINFEDSDSPI